MSAPTQTSETCPSCGSLRLPGAHFCTRCGRSYHAPVLAKPGSSARYRWGATQRGSDLVYVILAALLAVLISHLPLISVAIYPFKLFGTFVHEWCHALVALATGGSVAQLQINGDLSGETFTRGGAPLLIASAGYTGAAIVGAVLLLAPTRLANRTLVLLGALSILMPLVGSLAFGTSFPANTWLWAVLFGAVSLLVGLRAGPRAARIFQQFVAVELCFTALDSLRTLVWLSSNAPRVQTDALNAARYTHLPALLWAVVWGLIAVAAIGLALTHVVRRSLR